MNFQPRLRFAILFLLVLSVSHGLTSRRTFAQRGSLIEDLFRTIAEAELEKAQRKRADARRAKEEQKAAQRASRPGPPTSDPQQTARDQQRTVDQLRGRAQAPGRLTSFSAGADQFSNELQFLVNDVQKASFQTAPLRGVLPQLYQLSADARTLASESRKRNDYDLVSQRHREIDAHWRRLSFELRTEPGLNAAALQRVRDCDRYASDLCELVHLEPQIDRYRLHDNMIEAATYMQALLDDLSLCNLSRNDLRRYSHDGRVLRQTLLSQLDQVDQASYAKIVAAYNEFAIRWQPYSNQLHLLGNPFISRRLDRIDERCEETYALLWMSPPVESIDLTASAARLKRDCGDLLDQLTLRALAELDSGTRAQVQDGSSRLYQCVREFHQLVSQKADRQKIKKSFAEIDAQWQVLHPSYTRVRSINPATLGGIERENEHLRRVLGTGAPISKEISYSALLPAAASLEGGAEYIKDEIKRHQRELQPSSFRRSISRAADDFYDASKRLHAELNDREKLRTLQKEADRLVQAWRQLTSDISDARSRGLSVRKAQALKGTVRQLAPHVAAVAATLSTNP